jgi:hypothetical protein
LARREGGKSGRHTVDDLADRGAGVVRGVDVARCVERDPPGDVFDPNVRNEETVPPDEISLIAPGFPSLLR